MEDRTIRNEMFIFNKKAKSMDLNHKFIRKSYMGRIWVVLLIIIIFPINKEEAYAEAALNNFQNQENNEVVNNSKDNIKDEMSKFFTIDKKTYKILGEDKNSLEVMLWLCEGLSDSKDLVVDNQVKYNETIYDIKYIYDKAFLKINNVKNITIGDKILGFCDSSGNRIEDLDRLFYNYKELENIDLGNIECTLGENFFQGCVAMKNVKMSKNIHNIKRHCFDKCYSLNTIDFSEIKKINSISSFELCKKLKDIGEFNEELVELPARTFVGCKNLDIKNLKNIKKLGDDCFNSCSMLSQDILKDVEEIGKNCFWGCNFTELYLKRAKRIDDNAFGQMQRLGKIRFGNSEIPFLAEDIIGDSRVNEWIYPKEYAVQSEYLRFLSKLRVEQVIWNYNYGEFKTVITQDVKLNSLNPPKIERTGYEIEGWYKEPECINKVNKIADVGEITESDLVVKNPKLYANWRQKQVNKPEPTTGEDPRNPNEPGKPKPEEEPTKPSEPEKPKPGEEITKPSEPEKPKPGEEPTKPSEPEKPKPGEEPTKPSEPEKPKPGEEPTKPSEPEKPKPEEEPTKPSEPEKPKPGEEPTKPSEPEKPKPGEEITKPNEPHKSKLEELVKTSKSQKPKKKSKSRKRISLNKSNDETIKDENSKFSRKLTTGLNTENYIKEFNIELNNQNKDIDLKKVNTLAVDFEMVRIFILPIIRKNNVELEVLNWSYTDTLNNRMEITKNGVIGEIMNDHECIGIYLKNNDCFEKDSILKVKFQCDLNLSKLYSYNEELGKFILIDDNLKVNNNEIEIKKSNKREYLITKFDLNEEDFVVEGWNKILLKQSNANEISWIYLKGAEVFRGWNKIDNQWYYFKDSGDLAINTIVDGYRIGSDGKLI